MLPTTHIWSNCYCGSRILAISGRHRRRTAKCEVSKHDYNYCTLTFIWRVLYTLSTARKKSDTNEAAVSASDYPPKTLQIAFFLTRKMRICITW